MKPIKEELAEVPDLGFAGLAWRAKVHIESLEREIESLRSANKSLMRSIREEQLENAPKPKWVDKLNYKSEHGE